MPDIFAEIQKKKEEDIQKEVARRMENITAVRTKVLDLLKAERMTVQDAMLCLNACKDKLNLAFGEKPLTDIV